MKPPVRWGSIRVRLSLLYSAVVFGLGAILVSLVYIGVAEQLRHEPVTARFIVPIEGSQRCFRVSSSTIYCAQGVGEVVAPDQLKLVEKAAYQRALDRFRLFSFGGLGGLFGVSMVVGWVLSGRALRPIGEITGVAQDINASDLSRRINLEGPEDELKDLADTFDAMLDRIDEAFEQQRRFIHEASHELRNPIAVIRTNVDVALAAPQADASELRETLVVVGRAAERIGVLVDDLLLYARRESPADREALVDLATIVADTSAEFAVGAEARAIRLVASPGEGLVVHGDPVALRRALANLMANAVREAPAGSTIRTAAGRDGDWLWMAVQDEGPGIAPEDQPKVFERFYRGDPAGARRDGRSGLGLTIVKQIARAHGGSVGLRSAVGVGSTFSVWLPAVTVPAGEGGGEGDGAGDEAGPAGPEPVAVGGERAAEDR